MQSEAKTVEAYLADLPAERRGVVAAVRQAVLQNLPAGYEEVMQYGMISYVVPLKDFPEGYLGRPDEPLAYLSLASQKNHFALYLMCLYGNGEIQDWFTAAYKKSGKKLDMGKACVRFKKLDDLPLDLIGQVVAKVPLQKYVAFIRQFQAARNDRAKRSRAD